MKTSIWMMKMDMLEIVNLKMGDLLKDNWGIGIAMSTLLT